MKVVEDYPPAEVMEILEQYRPGLRDNKDFILTVGETLYNPNRVLLTPALIAHEEVHARQQRDFEGGFKQYAAQYFSLHLCMFRLLIEAEAYAAEIAVLSVGKDPGFKSRAVASMARSLGAPLYDLASKFTISDRMIAIEYFL